MSLYTKFGDEGETMLIGGLVVSKQHQRVQAYGTVDELSAALGVVIAEGVPDEIVEQLRWVQHQLYVAGSDLATVSSYEGAIQRITTDAVVQLEQWIDAADAALPDLHAFILPGGTKAGAHLHLARTICRRAEREAFRLSAAEEINPLCLQYLNRLSDFLFVLARTVTLEQGGEELEAKMM